MAVTKEQRMESQILEVIGKKARLNIGERQHTNLGVIVGAPDKENRSTHVFAYRQSPGDQVEYFVLNNLTGINTGKSPVVVDVSGTPERGVYNDKTAGPVQPLLYQHGL